MRTLGLAQVHLPRNQRMTGLNSSFGKIFCTSPQGTRQGCTIAPQHPRQIRRAGLVIAAVTPRHAIGHIRSQILECILRHSGPL